MLLDVLAQHHSRFSLIVDAGSGIARWCPYLHQLPLGRSRLETCSRDATLSRYRAANVMVAPSRGSPNCQETHQTVTGGSWTHYRQITGCNITSTESAKETSPRAKPLPPVDPDDDKFIQPSRYSRLGSGGGTNYSEQGSTECSEHRHQKPSADTRVVICA